MLTWCQNNSYFFSEMKKERPQQTVFFFFFEILMAKRQFLGIFDSLSGVNLQEVVNLCYTSNSSPSALLPVLCVYVSITDFSNHRRTSKPPKKSKFWREDSVLALEAQVIDLVPMYTQQECIDYCKNCTTTEEEQSSLKRLEENIPDLFSVL